MNDPSLPATGSFYDATSEQVQSWAFHNSLDTNQQHQLIIIAETFGNLDIEVFEEAIEMLIRRHESLRTCFRVIDEQVKQYVMPYTRELFAPSVYDMTIAGNRDELIKENIIRYESSLNRVHIPPLVKCCIFKLPDNKYYIYIMLHHIIADVWSASIVYRELTMFYGALMNGKTFTIEPLKMQLRDYAAWQKRWLLENGDAVRQYWTNKLSGLKDTFSFEKLYEQYRHLAKEPVTCNDRKTILNAGELLAYLNIGHSASYIRCVYIARYTQLIQLSLYCRSSVWAVINASLQLLFFLLAGKEKILIAMPVINRSVPGTETLIGSLGGGVYVQQPVREDMTIREFVNEGYLDFLESARHLIYDHKEMRLNGKALRLNSDVFANFINKEVMHSRKLDLGMDGRHQPLEGAEYYALSCIVSECEDGLLCNWKYNLDIYCPDLIEFMAATQQTLLQTMCQNPQFTIKELMKRIISDIPYEKNTQTNTPNLQRS